MPSESEMVRAVTSVDVDGTDETTFLKSRPWIIDANIQDPVALISTLRQEAARFKEFPRRPRLSLLAVLHDTPPQYLGELILSVRCQSYPYWELLLVDNGSTSRKHLDIARSWTDQDERIRLKCLDCRHGSSRARNLAIAESTGDYLIFADGDGVLHPMALGIFARQIIDDPGVNFVYTNEAEIDHHSTELTNFLVKPPLDLFTLLRVPYIGRLCAISRDLLERQAEGRPVFRDEYDGIEEHDLWLRLALTEGFEPRHAPLSTYYRRAGSHGIARLTDRELVARQKRLAEEFVPRVYPGATWSLKVTTDRAPLVSTSIWLTNLPGWTCPKLLIVIPFKDEIDTTIQCLESIEQQEHRLDVVVALVNNNSAMENTLPRLRAWIGSPRTSRYEILDHDGAFNFAKLNNRAVDRLGADRDLILLLNNDVELSAPQTLQTMAMQLLADPRIGFLGIKLYYPSDNEVQHGGVRVGELISGSGYNEVKHGKSTGEFVNSERITLGVTFACAMTRRETFQKLGGLEEVYLPNVFGDVSMCLLALEAGFRNYYLGTLSGIHHESKSRGSANEDLEFSFVYKRHGQVIASWRHSHLIKSHRYAWPLLVLPIQYESASSHHDLKHTAADAQANPTESMAPVHLPLRYRLADRLNGALKLVLGPLHGTVRSGTARTIRGVRAVRQPGGTLNLGRRILGPMPVVGSAARKCVRLARNVRHRSRVSGGLFKVLRRNPEAIRLLAMGLRHRGALGLAQSIRMLVPATSPAHPSPQEWFDATRPSRRLLAQFRRRRWPAGAPKFTIVTPVYNVKEEWLRQAVESVIAQTYPQWEMICVNDHSTVAHIRPVLDELSARDPRVRVIHCATNCGVSVATNLGIAAATGEYVAFMDHDDYLEAHALHRLAEAVLQDHPDMIYSDEAITEVDINRILRIACRPSFSYDYYLSHPFFAHLVAARTDIVRQAGGLNERMTISQDVDFVLRLIEACRNVAHVPDVLYRWRTHPESLGHQQKNNVYVMTRGALERHFERIGLAVDFDDKSHFNFRDLRIALTAPARIAIVIATKGDATRLRSCIAGLERTVPSDLAEIVILDCTADGPRARPIPADLGQRHRVDRFEGALSHSAILNRGAAASKTATHYLFLHDDTEALAPGWLEHMLGYAQRADVAIVGATLVYPDETVQHAGAVIGINGTHDHLLRNVRFSVPKLGRCGDPNGMLLASRDVSAVTAACLLVRADVFDRLAGFDEELDDRYYDLDLCLRAGALGYKVIQDAYAVLYHEEKEMMGSGQRVPHGKDLRRFLARHGARVFAVDPFYSPLLSPSSTDMPLAPARPGPEPSVAEDHTDHLATPDHRRKVVASRFRQVNVSIDCSARTCLPRSMTPGACYGLRKEQSLVDGFRAHWSGAGDFFGVDHTHQYSRDVARIVPLHY